MAKANNNKDQVFITFRGTDTRFGFLSHLKQKLKDGNVNVCTDSDLAGHSLESILLHIRESRIVIVIFSKNFAESHWCLDEVEEIKKCIETKKINIVIPIFHKVKVRSVKKQKGKFGEKFMALQESLLAKEGVTQKMKEDINFKIESWKKALEVVAGMIGLRYNKNRAESDFAKEVLEKVLLHLCPTTLVKEVNNDLKTTNKTLHGYTIYINNNHTTINNQNYYSTTVDALSVGKWDPHQFYDMDVVSKPSIGGHKRSNSGDDKIKQLRPYSVEALMSQKQNHTAKPHPLPGQKRDEINQSNGNTVMTQIVFAICIICIIVVIRL